MWEKIKLSTNYSQALAEVRLSPGIASVEQDSNALPTAD